MTIFSSHVAALEAVSAFYVFPNVSSFSLSAEEITLSLLDEAGIAVLAGTDFGPGSEGY